MEVTVKQSLAVSARRPERRRGAPAALEDEGVQRYGALLDKRVRRGELDAGTARAYLSDVRAFAHALAASAGGAATTTAAPEAVAEYFARVVAEASSSTARRKLASLRSFYGTLQEQGVVRMNPTQQLQPPPLRRSTPLRKPIQASVLKKLLAAPTTGTPKGLRDRALLILLALYGLPVIEAHRLNVEDVDLRAARLRVVGLLELAHLHGHRLDQHHPVPTPGQLLRDASAGPAPLRLRE